MIIEHYLKEQNIYLYIVDGNEIYYSDHKIEIDFQKLSAKNYQEMILRKIQEEAYDETDILAKEETNYTKSNEKNERKSSNLKIIIPTLIIATNLLLGIPILKEYKHEKQNIESLCSQIELENTIVEKVIILQNIAKEKVLNNKEISSLVKMLLSDYETREEGFLDCAIKCLNYNPNFTDEEKEALTKEITKKIHTFGKYYSEQTILNTLFNYTNVKVKRIEGLTEATYFKGVITYDPTWQEKYQILHHELCHAELEGMYRTPFFSEVRAAYLSKQGYISARAMMTILGTLGEEEKILNYVINHDCNQIWANLYENVEEKNHYKITYLESCLSALKAKEIESTIQSQSELQIILNSLYKEKYGVSIYQESITGILGLIMEQGNGTIETNDNLILKDANRITINWAGIRHSFSTQKGQSLKEFNINGKWLRMIQIYLQKELADISKEPDEKAYNYLMEEMGEENLERFLYSPNPESILCEYSTISETRLLNICEKAYYGNLAESIKFTRKIEN